MRFQAFLSYCRADDRPANWLHAKLDHFRTPKDLLTDAASGRVPDKLHPIFRDRTDMSGGGELTSRIKAALADSANLIVLCTPAAARSEWVNREVEAFLALGRADKIFPVIAPGLPLSADVERDFFPPALRGRGLLAADLRDVRSAQGAMVGDGRQGGLVKLLAGLLGVELDQLIRRERRRQRTIIAALSAASATFALAAGWAAFASYQANTRGELALSRLVTATEARLLNARGDIAARLDQLDFIAALESATAALAAIPSELREEDRLALEAIIDPLWHAANDNARLSGVYAAPNGLIEPKSYGAPQIFLTPGPFGRSVTARRYDTMRQVGSTPIVWRNIVSALQFSESSLFALIHRPGHEPAGADDAELAPDLHVVEVRSTDDMDLVRSFNAPGRLLCAGERGGSAKLVFVDRDQSLLLVDARSGEVVTIGDAERVFGRNQVYQALEASLSEHQRDTNVSPAAYASCSFSEAGIAIALTWSSPIGQAAALAPLPRPSAHLFSGGVWRRLAALPDCPAAIRACPPYLIAAEASDGLFVYRERLQRSLRSAGGNVVFQAVRITADGGAMRAGAINGAWPAPSGRAVLIAAGDGLFVVEGNLRTRLGDVAPADCSLLHAAWSEDSTRIAIACAAAGSGRFIDIAPPNFVISVFTAPQARRVGLAGLADVDTIEPYWRFRLHDLAADSLEMSSSGGLAEGVERERLSHPLAWAQDRLIAHSADGVSVFTNPIVANEYGGRAITATTADGGLVLASADGRVFEFDPARGSMRRMTSPLAERTAVLALRGDALRIRIAESENLSLAEQERLNEDANQYDADFSGNELVSGDLVGANRSILLTASRDCTINVADLSAWRALGRFKICEDEVLSPQHYRLGAGVSGDVLILPDEDGYSAYALNQGLARLWRVEAAQHVQVAEDAGEVWALEAATLVARNIASGEVRYRLNPPWTEVERLHVTPDGGALLIDGHGRAALFRRAQRTWSAHEDVRFSAFASDGAVLLNTGPDSQFVRIDARGRRRYLEHAFANAFEFRPVPGSPLIVLGTFAERETRQRLRTRAPVLRATSASIEHVGSVQWNAMSPSAIVEERDGFYQIESGLVVFHPARPARILAVAQLAQFGSETSPQPLFSNASLRLRPSESTEPTRLRALSRYASDLAAVRSGAPQPQSDDPLAPLIAAISQSERSGRFNGADGLFAHPARDVLDRFPFERDWSQAAPPAAPRTRALQDLERLARAGDILAKYYSARLALSRPGGALPRATALARLRDACEAALAAACSAAAITGEHGALYDDVPGREAGHELAGAARAFIDGARLGDAYAWFRIGSCLDEPAGVPLCEPLNAIAGEMGFADAAPRARAVEAYRMAELLLAPEIERPIGQWGMTALQAMARSARVNAAQTLTRDEAQAISERVAQRMAQLILRDPRA